MVLFTDVNMSDQLRYLYRRIGLLGDRRHINAITNGGITNFPVYVEDIRRAVDIYGPDVVGLKVRVNKEKAVTNRHSEQHSTAIGHFGAPQGYNVFDGLHIHTVGIISLVITGGRLKV